MRSHLHPFPQGGHGLFQNLSSPHAACLFLHAPSCLSLALGTLALQPSTMSITATLPDPKYVCTVLKLSHAVSSPQRIEKHILGLESRSQQQV